MYSFFCCQESLVDPILVIQALFFSHLMAIVKNNGTVAIAKPLFFSRTDKTTSDTMALTLHLKVKTLPLPPGLFPESFQDWVL